MANDFESMTLEQLHAEKRSIANKIAALKATKLEIAGAIQLKRTEQTVDNMNETQKDSLRQVLGKK